LPWLAGRGAGPLSAHYLRVLCPSRLSIVVGARESQHVHLSGRTWAARAIAPYSCQQSPWALGRRTRHPTFFCVRRRLAYHKVCKGQVGSPDLFVVRAIVCRLNGGHVPARVTSHLKHSIGSKPPTHMAFWCGVKVCRKGWPFRKGGGSVRRGNILNYVPPGGRARTDHDIGPRPTTRFDEIESNTCGLPDSAPQWSASETLGHPR